MAQYRKIYNIRYTIHNDGTNHAFDPNKKVIHPFENKETTLLDVHLERVEMANSVNSKQKRVYITDENGRLLVKKS